jgi:hypothetical protein
MTREDALRWSDIGSRIAPWVAMGLLTFGATTVAEVRADIRGIRADLSSLQVKIAEDRGVFMVALGKLEERISAHEKQSDGKKGEN